METTIRFVALNEQEQACLTGGSWNAIFQWIQKTLGTKNVILGLLCLFGDDIMQGLRDGWIAAGKPDNWECFELD